MIDIVLLNYVLSAIASTGRIIESAIALFGKGMNAHYDVLKAEADIFGKDLVSNDDIDILRNLADNIPDGMLEAMQKSIDSIQKRLVEIFSNTAMSELDKEQRMMAEKRHICWYISQVGNYGSIPDSLNTVWILNKCSETGYTLRWSRN